MMKISELTPDAYFDLLGEILPIAPKIIEIPEVKALLSGGAEKGEKAAVMMGAFASLACLFVKEHRAATYRILAIINGCTVEEVRTSLTPPEITKQIVALFKDEDFSSFLLSAGKSGPEQ